MGSRKNSSTKFKEMCSRAFDMLDPQGDGALDKQDLVSMLSSVGYNTAKIQKSMLELNADSGAFIDKAEFQKLSSLMFADKTAGFCRFEDHFRKAIILFSEDPSDTRIQNLCEQAYH